LRDDVRLGLTGPASVVAIIEPHVDLVLGLAALGDDRRRCTARSSGLETMVEGSADAKADANDFAWPRPAALRSGSASPRILPSR